MKMSGLRSRVLF